MNGNPVISHDIHLTQNNSVYMNCIMYRLYKICKQYYANELYSTTTTVEQLFSERRGGEEEDSLEWQISIHRGRSPRLDSHESPERGAMSPEQGKNLVHLHSPGTSESVRT